MVTRRKRALSMTIEDQVLTNAGTVVHDGPHGVVVGYRTKIHHGLHFVLTLLTGGLWAVVWLVDVLVKKQDRVLFEADPWGHVWARRVASA